MNKSVPACLGVAVVLSAAAFVSSCLDPLGAAGEPIPPPGTLVGPFTFADETGRLTLEFPSGKARTAAQKTVYVVEGTLDIQVPPDAWVHLSVAGTYDDSDGHVVAEGQGEVDGEPTTYSVDGYYVVGSGFSGTIERDRAGQVTSGEVAALGGESEGTLEIRVFTGAYGALETSETWKYEQFPEELPVGEPDDTEIEDRFDLDGDAGMGTFCFTCSAELFLGVFHNYLDFDEQEDSGVLYGSFTDPPTNTHFELEVMGREAAINIWGQIDGSQAFGDWEMQHWLEPYLDTEINLWCYKRVTQIGTFEGALVP